MMELSLLCVHHLHLPCALSYKFEQNHTHTCSFANPTSLYSPHMQNPPHLPSPSSISHSPPDTQRPKPLQFSIPPPNHPITPPLHPPLPPMTSPLPPPPLQSHAFYPHLPAQTLPDLVTLESFLRSTHTLYLTFLTTQAGGATLRSQIDGAATSMGMFYEKWKHEELWAKYGGFSEWWRGWEEGVKGWGEGW